MRIFRKFFGQRTKFFQIKFYNHQIASLFLEDRTQNPRFARFIDPSRFQYIYRRIGGLEYSGKSPDYWVTKNWASEDWPRFCRWQSKNKNALMRVVSDYSISNLKKVLRDGHDRFLQRGLGPYNVKGINPDKVIWAGSNLGSCWKYGSKHRMKRFMILYYDPQKLQEVPNRYFAFTALPGGSIKDALLAVVIVNFKNTTDENLFGKKLSQKESGDLYSI